VSKQLTVVLQGLIWDWQENDARKSAYNALTRVSGYYVTDFSYLVWNDFVEYVKKCVEKSNTGTNKVSAYGYSNITYIDLLNYAKMSSSDTVMTAQRFNIVRYVIDKHSTFNDNSSNSIKMHYIEAQDWDMKKNEIMKGQYFLDLTTYANKIIE
jgi:hypothetical protein